MILLVSDFISGSTSIAGDDYTNSDLETYITNDIEKKYIYQMLGSTLGQTFIDDLAGTPSTPTSAEWIAVFSTFNFDVSDYPVNCVGIKNILISLIYRDYVSGQNIGNQITGNKSISSEASRGEGIIGKSTIFYNRTVKAIEALQYFVVQDPTTYPDYKGISFEFEAGI